MHRFTLDNQKLCKDSKRELPFQQNINRIRNNLIIVTGIVMNYVPI